MKTIWADGYSRDKENKACLKKQEQEWRAQIPSGGGKRENKLCALDRKGFLEKPLAKDNKVPIY